MNLTNLEQSLEATVEDNVKNLAGRLRPQIEEAKIRLRSLNGEVTGYIKQHPAACLLGAAAVGYLIARLARRQQS